MFYTYFNQYGVQVDAYTSSPMLASMIARDAPTFEYVKDAEAWIRDVANPKYQEAMRAAESAA